MDWVATVSGWIEAAVGALGVVVLIRTFLSFSLETEIEGRPPWQRSGAQTS